MNKALIFGIITGLIIGFFVGFYFGIDIVIDRMVKVLPVFTDIKIDAQAINDALFKYQNNINSCIK